MKNQPVFGKKRGERRDCCFLCDETGPRGSMIRCYVYLPTTDELGVVIACKLHDNSHRIVGNERPIRKHCKVNDCYQKIKCKEMCKSHYNSFFIGYPVVR